MKWLSSRIDHALRLMGLRPREMLWSDINHRTFDEILRASLPGYRKRLIENNQKSNAFLKWAMDRETKTSFDWNETPVINISYGVSRPPQKWNKPTVKFRRK